MTVATSVIIRTLNEAKHLENLLKGIHDQNYSDWEIILVDSGSTDGTLDIAQRYGARIYHIPQEEFTFGRSLNLGCEKAHGRYLQFASGHVRPVNNSWLRNMIKPFEESSVAMVYGRQRGTNGSRISEQRDMGTYFGQTSHILLDEPRGNNGNAAVRRDLWLTQPFDESLPGLEDIDWARKIQRRGCRVYYAADAGVYHIHEETLKQVYRRHLRESITYKRIFPGHRFTLVDMIKGLSYAIVRDYLYAYRRRKYGKSFQIPWTRLAEFLGIRMGVRHQERLNGQAIRRLEIRETNHSVVIDGPGTHALRRTETPKVGPDEVLINVAYVGVCATDLEVASGQLDYYQKGVARYPIIPGHEYSGVVMKSGDNVRHLRKGQKVVGECAIGCGHCPNCTTGEYYRCAGREEIGVINRNGAYADYLVVPSSYVHKLPNDMPLKYGAIVEPVAVCLKGLNKLVTEPGRTVCVVGAGSIGNLCAQILQSRGLGVTVVDRDESRLGLLHKYDINTLTELGGLDRYDYLVEASGNEEVIAQLIENSKASAKVLLLGLPYTQPIQTVFSTITSYDKVIYGSVASHSKDWEVAIRMVHKGGINLDDHTAVVEPLESYQKVWDGVEVRQYFKVLLRISNDLEAI